MNPIPLIIYEDDDIVLVDKPAGVIVNRADTNLHVVTLQDWAEKNIKYQKSKINNREQSDFEKRSGIVHRLDKDTSGVLILAKNEESFKVLQAQFKEGSVQKTYLALVHGKVLQEEGEITAPIGRLPWDRMKFGVIPMGRESATHYKVIEYYIDPNDKEKEILTLLEAYPKTGRTHQIRVHFRYLGYPLVGDSLYAGRKNIQKDNMCIKRHFLHAHKITFTHPKKGDQQTFESPLSEELSRMLLKLTPIAPRL